MKRLLPPICLFIALVMLVVAICLLAVGPPEASLDLHEARADNNDVFTDVWEADLRQRQLTRTATIVILLGGSVAMAINAFRSMR